MEAQSRRTRRPVDRRLEFQNQLSTSPWREAVRKACVDRAKKKRRDLLWKHRQTGSTLHEEPILRTEVEEELGRLGVAVVTPGHFDSGQEQDTSTILMSPVELDFKETHMHYAEEELSDHNREPYYLSEEELYELMQEVANEVDESLDEALLEEALELEQLEFEAQVAEFELWEANGDEEELICPVCTIGNLSISNRNHTLNCSNRACRLQQYTLSNDSPTLNSLRDRLARAYEYHVITCQQPLSVQLEMHMSTGRPLLAGTCDSCGIRMEI